MVPSVAAPSVNVTVPLGTPVTGAEATVAVNVTAWPGSDGLTDDVSVVDVTAWTTLADSVTVPIDRQLPPASGHSKTLKCAVCPPRTEAVKPTVTVQAASLSGEQPIALTDQGAANAPSVLEKLARL